MPQEIERWPQAKQILLDALEQPSRAQEDFVRQRTGDDVQLRDLVLGLLRAHYDAPSFLGTPTLPDEASMPDSAVGDIIGGYRILDVLGEGGFGVVYAAETITPPTRRVALKVIKLGMDTRQVLARFEAEQQALALLDHPNIVKVLEAGSTENGRPYFVMELVRGVPITEYCDRARLTTQARLDLFIAICRAVQHAHQRGIIHRDIKPTNVLVALQDGVPTVKIIDFGIAKATDRRLTERTLVTEAHQFIGTPEYMSPEQAELTALDVDTRTDLYALGVLLYELLTGTTPFERETLRGVSVHELQRMIREDDPVRPSSRVSRLGDRLDQVARQRRSNLHDLQRQLRGDLDWIIMKAIEKDRTRRYQTASEFAEDLERSRSNRPVIARPPSASYRARKMLRRHRVAVLLVATVFVSAIVTSVVSIVAAVHATAARDAEIDARTQAEAVTRFLERTFQQADPAVGSRDVRVVDVLARAASGIGDDFAEQPEVQVRLRRTIGRVYRRLGLLEEAEAQLRLGLTTADASLHSEHPLRLRIMNSLAVLCADRGKFQEATRRYQELLPLEVRVFGPTSTDALGTMTNIGMSYYDEGEMERAAAALETSFTAHLEHVGPSARTTLITQQALGNALNEVGRHDEAARMFRDVAERTASSSPDIHINAISNLGVALAYQKKFDLAAQQFRAATELSRRTNGPEHWRTGNYIANHGWVRMEAREWGAAERLLLDADRVLRVSLDPYDGRVTTVAGDLVALYEQMNRPEDVAIWTERRDARPEAPE